MTGSAGRIVRILSFSDSGAATEEFWWAAFDDDAAAVKAVALAARTIADQGVSVVGQLSPADLAKSGLKSGETKPAPR
jgi:hypothetical protein